MDSIRIRGARQHNLQNIDVDIPRGELVVITGPSGSGKSSLAFHTLFAEGQRRYVESLSTYARQFLDQMEKPDVDAIEGLTPAIAIEQRSGGLNPRSTVATATEIHDYLRVLWAAAGTPHDPVTGEMLQRMTSADIVAALNAEPEGAKVILLAPVPREEAAEPERLLGDLQRQGFIRIRLNGELVEIDEAMKQWPENVERIEVVVDRMVIRPGGEARLADSVEAALRICGSEARAAVQRPDRGNAELSFQTSFRNPATGFVVGDLTPRHFSFNSHLGACAACEGLGTETFCDPALMIADAKKPLNKGGLRGWWTAGSSRERKFHKELAMVLRMFDLPEDATAADLTEASSALLFQGGELDTGWRVGREKAKQTQDSEGLSREAERLLREAKTDITRRKLSRVMAQRACRVCHGQRLKPEWLAVRIEGAQKRWLGIADFCGLTIADALGWLNDVNVPADRAAVCGRLVADVKARLEFLQQVGVDYLQLDRSSGTLSGGEAQRIRLASQLGAGLAGVTYVLDEPSIGLHAADTARLIAALKSLRDKGNTVVVVEHDEEIIRAADWLIELGPGAGREGGKLLDAAKPEALNAPTGEWLRRETLPTPPKPRTLALGSLVIRNAREHNLRNLDVEIPLGGLVCIAGPSGSGKSTLATDILQRALARHFHNASDVPGAHDAIEGMDLIGKLVIADQSPIGRSPRSNPATFTGAFDQIREWFAQLPLSRQRGYNAGRFSFNTAGGRCEKCEGAGRLKIEMHFLPDAWVSCTACQGKRFNRETLEIAFKGRSISDVLDMNISEAAGFFRAMPKLHKQLQILCDLGLGYLALGQAANTLSGGEAQRLKLAVELAKPQAPHTLYVFDEPTTGLHFGDVEKLLGAFQRLIDAGHSVVVIEHHLDVIAASDWVIELGPGGGQHGGALVAAGPPRKLASKSNSATGQALARRHFPV